MRRNHVVPAARNMRMRIESENALRNGVAVMMIVKKPCVQLQIAERGLNFGKVHCHAKCIENLKQKSQEQFPLGNKTQVIGAVGNRAMPE